MIYKLFYIFLFIFFFTPDNSCLANNDIEFSDEETLLNISSKLFIYEDKTSCLSFEEAILKDFVSLKTKVPNLGISESTFWIKIPLRNLDSINNILLYLPIATLDNIEFYYPTEVGYEYIKAGESLPFNARKYKDPDYLFDFGNKYGVSQTYYLRISSKEGIQIPLFIGTERLINNQIKKRDILSGIYFGIMIVMMLYNLFIYFSVKDTSYIYYVIYIILILLTQTSLQGYPFQYLWPNYPIIAQNSLFIFPSLVGIASMIFMNVFLKIKSHNSTLYKLSFLLSIPYLISIGLALFQSYKFSFMIMEFNAMTVSFYMLYTAIIIVRKGYQPAKYFLAAWVVFLVGVVIYILKDFEVLPYNNFTRYTMQIGSAIETVLLSFALAARINDYKKEKEISQLQAYQALEEKKQLILNQNVMLELKVDERTQELNKTLDHLKETQTQLVDAEKMASLGQLTAGIAHEINNPINFVSSNIPPLRQDIDDLKSIINKYEEINSTNLTDKLGEIAILKQHLDYEFLKTELDGIIGSIENGANRTTEIVKSLRNFSRLDESDLMSADLNEGINSALVLLRSEYAGIKINKNLGKLPKIECYPGKLNQVFLNLLNNAIYAVRNNKFNESVGKIEVQTLQENEVVKIIISDNGMGIKQEFLEKIFDPFFTTKEVGEGTGLGLSIVYRIIESHHGKIEVNSEINKGTTFTITLPIHQKK